MKLSRKLLSSVIFLAMSAHFLRAASDITITTGANSNISGGPIFTGTAAPSNLNVGTLTGITGLSGGNATVDATSGSGGSGLITVTDSILWATNNSLTLVAGTNILLNGAITNNAANTGDLILTATAGTVAFNSDISMLNTGSDLTVTTTGISQTTLDTSRTLQIGGLATLNAGTGSITLGNANNFGSLNLTGGTVSINEASSTLLTGVSATTLTLTSSGAITDSAGASINVTGLATLNAGANAITLGDVGGGTTNFGSLNMTGSIITIIEDSGSDLNAISASNTLTLTSSGNITDSGNISVTNHASLSAGTGNITIGDAGETTNFGSLSFNTSGSVNIQEDSATSLVGTSTAGSLVLASSGAITNTGTANLGITGNASFSGTSITLGTVTGDTMNFGSLTFNSAGTVWVQENSDTVLTGSSTSGNLILSSTAAFTDTGVSSLGVTGTASITAGAGSSIILDDTAITVSGNTTLTASAGQDIIVSNALNNFTGTVTFSPTATLANVSIRDISDFDIRPIQVSNSFTAISGGALTDSGNFSVGGLATLGGSSINIGGVTETTNFGSLNFNSSGTVTIQEDSATVIAGSSSAGSLTLSSSASVTDTALSSLNVTGAASITAGAGTSIVLDDTAFTVGGNTTLTANSGQDIIISNTGNNFSGTVTFATSSGTLANVNVYDISAFDLQALAVSNSLIAISQGALTDSGNLSVTGQATLGGSSINIGGAGETTNFGSLNFNSTGTATIQEDDSTLLTGVNTAGAQSLTSSGAITNSAGASVSITNNASFSGTSITLGTATGDTMNFGTLTFNSAGAVTISEDSAMSIDGTNTGAATSLTSTAGISDSASSSINVGALILSGTSINLGSGGSNTFNASTLNFNSGGAVNIDENSNMDITGTNTALSAALTSTGSLADDSTSSITVTNLGSFSGTSISLGVGASNTFNTGTLTFNSAGAVTISENSSMDIVGTNTGAATSLTSSAGISDSATSSINVGALTLNGTSINLGSGGTNTFNASTLNFNSSGAVNIDEDSNMDITGTNTALSAALTSTGSLSDDATSSITIDNLGSFSGTSISLGVGASNTFNTGTLTFNSAGAVTISENSGMDIVGTNTGGTTSLDSSGGITDSATSSINVGALSLSGTSISLGVGASNTLNATTLNFNSAGAVSISENSSMDIVGTNTGGTTNLTSSAGISDSASSSINLGALTLSGTSISLGSGGSNTFNASTLNFNSGGAVNIDEDSNMDITGTNTALSAALTSTGSLADDSTSSITVTNLGSFSGTSISLGVGASNSFDTGTLTFNSAGDVTISENSSMDIVGNNTGGATNLTSSAGISDSATSSINVGALTLNGTSINLGSGGTNTFNASTLNFNSGGAVNIDEDSNMDITGTNTALSAALTSTGSLSDDATSSITIDNLGSFSGTSISLGVGASNTFNTGTLTFHSAGAVTISENSGMDIVGTNTGGTTSLDSSGGISDSATSSINVGALSLSGTSISLGVGASNTLNATTLNFNSVGAVSISENSSMDIVGTNTGGATSLSSTAEISDSATSSINVGALTLNGTSIDLGVGSSNTFNASTLNFTASGSIVIVENGNMDIVGVNAADSADLSAQAALSDASATSVNIAGLGDFSGTSISLGGGIFNAGTLIFNSSGAVTILEDSGMDIVGINNGGTTSLSSTAGISDAGATSINVGALTLDAASVSLGGGIFNASTLNFNASGAVVIAEDSNMDLVGVNTAGSANLSSTGALSDENATSVDVTGLGSFSGTSISLGGGIFNAGTLTFNSSGAVTVVEDSSMDIVGVNTGGSTNLRSTAGISDAGATSIHVEDLTLDGTSIDLGGGIFNASTLNFSSTGAVDIAEDSNMDLVGVNVAGSASLSSTGALSDAGATSVDITGLGSFSGTSISLGGGTFNTGTLTFNSGGAVTILEDSAMDIVGVNTGGATSLSSTAGISDTGATSIKVGALTLDATSIRLGGGIFNASNINFNSPGAVDIAEDSNMSIVGENTADSANLSSTGALSDANATSLDIAGLGSFSGASISLGGGTFNTGTLTFNSGGAVTILEDSSIDIVGVNTGGATRLSSTAGISDAGATGINVGALRLDAASISLGAGIFNASTINFNSAGSVGIAEDSGMAIVGVNTAASATLSSTGALSDASATSVTISGLGDFSGASIGLGGGIFNTGTLTFHSTGAVTVAEDSSMDIVGVNTGGSTSLRSTAAIMDSTSSVINVGALDITGTSIRIGVGAGNTFNAATLNFNASGSVNVHEDGSMTIAGTSTGGTTYLQSTAGISDSSNSSTNVGALTLVGTSISLGVGAGNTFNAASLNFNSAGSVAISENSGMKIVGSNVGGATSLASTAGITDSADSLLSTAALAVKGTSINLGVGSGNTLNAETLNFNSAGSITMEEDSSTDLVGANTAGTLSLTSVAAIADVGAASLNITGLGNFNGTSIRLGDGVFNAGSLTFNSAGSVSIAEDSSMRIVGTNTGATTVLSSSGGLSDSSTSSIQVGALSVAGTSIQLGVGAGNTLNAGTINFNSTGSVTIHEDSATRLVGAGTAGKLEMVSTESLATAGNLNVAGLASFTGTSIVLGGSTQNTNFGSLRVNASGDVTVQEDSDTTFVGSNTAGILKLLSSGITTFKAGSTLNANSLLLQTQTLSLTGDNLVNTVSVTLANGTTLTLSGNDTIGRITSNGATIAGGAVLTAVNGATLNGGVVSGNLRGNTTSTKNLLVSGTLGGGYLSVTGGALTLTGRASNSLVTISPYGSIRNASGGFADIAQVSNSGLLTMQAADTVANYLQKDAGILAGNSALTVTNLATLSGGQVTGILLGNTKSTGNVSVSGRLGGGSLTVADGTLNLSGKSTNGKVGILGATSTSATGGSLVVSKGGLSSNANVTNAGKLVINASESINRYIQNGNGSLSGTAALSVRNGATLNGGRVLGSLLADTVSTGTVSISGSVQGDKLSVTGGKLVLTGTATADTTVSTGATLQGKGRIVGDLTNNGTTARSLSISGDLVTTGRISLNITNGTKFDRIVADTAVMGGQLVVRNTGAGLESGQRVKIIDADVYQNEFTSFTALGFDNGVIFDDRTGILVGLGRDIFKTAAPLHDITKKSSNYLNLDKNQTSSYLALFEDSVDIGRQNVTYVGDKLRLVSGVANGDQDLVDALILSTTSTPGEVDADTVNRLSPEAYRGMADYTKMAIRTHSRQATEAAPVSREGDAQVFATVHSNIGGADDSASMAGSDIEMAGATAGFRYDINRNFGVGVMLGMDDGTISGSLIDADAQGFVAGGFGTYQLHDARNTRILAGVSYGSYSFDATRASLGGNVSSGDVDSNAFEFVLGATSDIFVKDNLRVTGSAALRYMAGEVDSFDESGSGILLGVDSQDIDSLQLDLGVDLTYQLSEKFSLGGHVGYIQELSGSDNTITSRFLASGAAAQPFTVSYESIDGQAFVLGVGLFYDVNEHTRLNAIYRSEFGSDSKPTQTIGIGASFGF